MKIYLTKDIEAKKHVILNKIYSLDDRDKNIETYTTLEQVCSESEQMTKKQKLINTLIIIISFVRKVNN